MEVVKQACIDDVEASKAIGSSRVTKIVISASGMATATVRCTIQSLHARFEQYDPACRLPAAGTRGRSLQDGAKELRIPGDWIPVNAGVAHLDILSAHAMLMGGPRRSPVAARVQRPHGFPGFPGQPRSLARRSAARMTGNVVHPKCEEGDQRRRHCRDYSCRRGGDLKSLDILNGFSLPGSPCDIRTTANLLRGGRQW